VVAILGLLAPPVFAQAPPAPKVTISGLVDFVTTIYNNSTGDCGPTLATCTTKDITDGGKDRGWYSRERGVFTITGEVGKSKGVLALEFDFANGRTATNFDGGGFGGNLGLDIETDEKGQAEVKWLYLETPITGPGSLMPFIPVASIGRFGGQPARGHDYKPGILFSGDFAGATLETTWAPNLRSTLTYVQIDEGLDPVTNPGGTEDWAILASVEIDVFKGLTVKPTYSFVRYDGGSSSGNAGTFARSGFNPSAASQANRSTSRHTFGGDVRWTAGPWSLQPTFLYQVGTQETVQALANNQKEVDIRSWIFDVIGGFRSGPLTVEGRFAWTPGNKVNECVNAIAGVCSGGSDIDYYEGINQSSTGYWAGWADIESSGIDYNVALRQTSGSQLGRSPSYDKYGRIIVGGALDYALTPALVFHVVTNFQWTAEKVDTNSTVTAGTGGASLVPVKSSGDKRYLGNEWDVGFTYRFAPNVAFDLIGAYLFAGDARDHGRSAASTTDRFDADDAYKLSARVRLTW
jgi:hypothetical protein